MKAKLPVWILAGALALAAGVAQASKDGDTISLFKHAGQSAAFFDNSYGFAVFPTIGKGGIGIGAAHGTGHVYESGKRIGSVTMNQVSVGLQLGGLSYSQIIFFENKSALDDFTSGNFEFSADAGAIAVTAAAAASAGTTGARSSASADKDNATTAGQYTKGMAVFTIAKGGLMANATIGGQKFTYKAHKAK